MVEHEDLPTSEPIRNYRNRITLVSGIVCFCFFLFISYFFAPLGFSPTDDGYILSMSNKIFYGENPHKDFISIRPVASSVLALYSFLPIFESIQLLLTRILCTLEFVSIVWMWMQIVLRFRPTKFSMIFVVATTIITTVITVHDFPLMAWHTIDGIFFCSLALLLRTKQNQNPSKSTLFFSYVFFGMAVLCKQSFAPMVFASLLVFQDYKRILPIIGILFFPFIYTGWIATNGGMFDLLFQLTAQSKILGVGFKRYLIDFWWLGGILIGIGIWYLQKNLSEPKRNVVNLIVFLAIVLLLLLDLIFGKNLSHSSVLLFGVLIPITIRAFIQKKDTFLLLAMFTVLAWSSALSIGYSFPSLISGGMILVLFLELQIEVNQNWKSSVLCILCGICFLTAFVYVRTNHIYREQPVNNLTYPLGEVMKNGKGIYTNERTFSFMKDVQTIRNSYSKAIILFAPDMAGLYSSAQYNHPTISTWSRNLELPSRTFYDQFLQNLQNLANNDCYFTISKYKVDSLAYTLTSLNTETSDSPVVRFAKNNLRLVDSTRFFYIYTK